MSEPTATPPRSATALALKGCDVPSDWSLQLQRAELLASANSMMPKHYRGDPGAVLAAMMHAQTLDISMWLAIQETYVHEGQVGMSAALMHALMLRAGHKVHIVEESPKAGCKLRLERWDQPDNHDLTAQFTPQDALTAGVLGKANWERYPTDMFYARAMGRLARRHARDVVLGFAYTKEELEDGVIIEGEYTDTDTQINVAGDRLADAVAGLVQRCDEAENQADVMKIVTDAERQGMMTQYTANGRRLRDVLVDRWHALAPATDDKQQPPVSESSPVLECGCNKVSFVAGGGHQTGCTQRDTPVVDGDSEILWEATDEPR